MEFLFLNFILQFLEMTAKSTKYIPVEISSFKVTSRYDNQI